MEISVLREKWETVLGEHQYRMDNKPVSTPALRPFGDSTGKMQRRKQTDRHVVCKSLWGSLGGTGKHHAVVYLPKNRYSYYFDCSVDSAPIAKRDRIWPIPAVSNWLIPPIIEIAVTIVCMLRAPCRHDY